MKSNVLFFALFALPLMAAPTISNVRLSTDDGQRTLIVKYDLSEEAVVTMDILQDGVSLGSAATEFVTGDANREVAAEDDRVAIWAAEKAYPGHSLDKLSVRLDAWAKANPPPYMVVDLRKANERTYYRSADLLPGGGLDNDEYRTIKLVMRKIPAQGVRWRMGKVGGTSYDTPHYVNFTENYYIGVFELTQGQCELVTGSPYSKYTCEADSPLRPVDSVHYGTCRGGYATSESNYQRVAGDGSEWPDAGHKVATDSILGKFRTRTGLELDLPTSAQWEYASRAGCPDAQYGTPLTDIAWCASNSGIGLLSNQAHRVGTRIPNAWGVYDMYGNVGEWVLDRDTDGGLSADEVTDPKGPTIVEKGGENGRTRLCRGGGYNSYSDRCCSLNPWPLDAWYGPMLGYGLRVTCPIP